MALPGATLAHWRNLGAACYWVPELRGRAQEAYERAVTLGEQAREASARGPGGSGRARPSYADSGAPDRRRESRGASSASTEDPRAHRAAAASRRRSAIELGTTYEELGDREKALDWLARAIQAGYPLERIERSPWLKDLRSDERYTRGCDSSHQGAQQWQKYARTCTCTRTTSGGEFSEVSSIN